MEDFSPADIALDYGYYQMHSEALPLLVLAVVAIVLVQMALAAKRNQ